MEKRKLEKLGLKHRCWGLDACVFPHCPMGK